MSNQEILYSESISRRTLPVNFNHADIGLFEHELKKTIPATTLLHLKNYSVNPAGIIFPGCNILPESFPDPRFLDDWGGLKAKLKIWVFNFYSGVTICLNILYFGSLILGVIIISTG